MLNIHGYLEYILGHLWDIHEASYMLIKHTFHLIMNMVQYTNYVVIVGPKDGAASSEPQSKEYCSGSVCAVTGGSCVMVHSF